MEQYLELDKQLTEATDEYYRLRDAKSNGCCHGMSILQVMAYDEKIIQAKNKILNIQEQLRQL